MKEENVVWFSHGFGYGTELMYFEGILLELSKLEGRIHIAVPKDFPTEKYAHLPLLPILKCWNITRSRKINGIAYEATIKLPTIHSVWEIVMTPFKAAIVVEFSPISTIAALVARIKGAKVLLLIENHPRYRSGASGNKVNFIKGLLAKLANAVITSNSETKEYAIKNLAIKESKILVRPFLTSQPNYFQTIDQTQYKLRKRPGRINILFLNSLTPRKGISRVIESLALLHHSVRTRLTLHIAGDGSEMSKLKELAANLELNDCIEFYGHIDFKNTKLLYEQCDVVISPTLSDYRSLTGFEAISSGKPIILSIHDGSANEIVGDAGWLIDPLIIPNIAKTIENVVMDEEDFARKTAASCVLANKFRYDQIARNIASGLHLARNI